MPDLDDDRDTRRYVRGRGRPQRTKGPVDDAYTTCGAINRPCPNCGAKPFEYCHRPDGSESTIPCLQRLSERTR